MISCKKIYLCSPDLKPICVLNGVQTNSVTFSTHVKDYSTLSFTVDRFITDTNDSRYPKEIESSGYEYLKIYMYLYLEDIGFFQMQAPKVVGNGNFEQKEVVAYSIEKEFEQKDWLGLKINTGESDSIEYLADNNIDALGFAKEYVTLLNNTKPQLSFLHLMIEKCPGWEIGEVDESIATRKIPYVDSDNTNLYALMTSEVAPRMRILFMFDFLHKRINAYDQDSIEYDTNIYISFRNLANRIELNVDEDSVYTRFRVRGNDDFMLNDWNLNSDMIMDISYFLCEPYMSEELAQRVKDWMALREELRVQCAEVATSQAQVNEKLYKLNYAVPSNACLWRNWSSMREDGLDKNLEYYQARLRQLQMSVDPRPDSEKFIVADDVTTYSPIRDASGNVDHNYYTTRLYNSDNEFKGYYTYLEINTYIIPYIRQAKININLPNDEQVKYGNEAEENWTLYGKIELEGKLKSYEQDKLPMLRKYEKDWDELTSSEKTMYVNEDAYNRAGHANYLHYVEEIGDENTEGTIKYQLKILNTEIAKYETELADLTEQRQNIINEAQMDQYFNESEIKLLNTLFIDTDYTNSNILVTDIDDVYTTMETEKDLYEDSYEMLTRCSQPQYKAVVELDNLLRLEEFADWHDDLKLLHFIHVAIREDYSIKLRVVGMSWNPCEITPMLTLEFSNMIVSYRGRSDLDDVLSTENFRGQKNSISIGTGNSKTDMEYLEYLLEELQSHGYLAGIVDEEIQSATISNVDEDTIKSIVSDYIGNINVNSTSTNLSDDDIQRIIEGIDAENLAEILNGTDIGAFQEFVSKNLSTIGVLSTLMDSSDEEKQNLQELLLSSNDAYVRDLIADAVVSNTVSTRFLEANAANITNLVATNIEAETIATKLLHSDSATITELFSDKIQANEVVTSFLQASSASIVNLVASEINADSIAAQMLISDSAVITDLFADKIQANEVVTSFLQASSANIMDLVSTELTSQVVVTKLLQATAAQLNTLVVDHISATDIVTKLLEADNASINNLVAQKVSAEQIFAKFASIDGARIDDLFSTNITADTIVTKIIEAQDARITSLITDTITSEIILTKFLDADSASITNLVTEHLSADAVVAKLIEADEATVNSLIADRIQSDTIVTKLLNAEEGAVDNLISTTVTSETIVSKLVESELGVLDDLIADHLSASTIVAKLAEFDDASIGNLIANNISADTIITKLLNADSASFNNLLVTQMDAETIITKIINAESAEFGEFIAQYATIDEITASEITTKLLSADIADIQSLQSLFITSDIINTMMLEADQATIDFLSSSIITAENANLQTVIADKIASTDITAANIIVDNISGTDAQFNNFFAEHIDVDEIFGNNADFQNIVAQYVVAETIDAHDIITELLTATSADIQRLRASYVDADYINSLILNADSAIIGDLQSTLITTDVINARLLEADEGTISFLTSQVLNADNAELQSIVSDIIEANDIQANSINVSKIVGDEAQFNQFFANKLDVDTIFGNNANFQTVVANSISTNTLVSKLASITQANVETLFVENAFTNALQSLSSTTARSVITDAYIYNAVAGKIAVADLLAGDITISDNMRIISDSGALIMNGEALQIIGHDENGNSYVGIQLGYDATDNPSLIIRNEEGNVVMTAEGITEDAIAEQLIRNDMIKDATIEKSKLGFSVIEANAYGGIDISQVYDGQGNRFGVEYTSFKNNITTSLSDLNTKIDENAIYSLHIEAPNGTNVNGGNITLKALLFKNNQDVTDEFNASYFIWTRTSNDSAGDLVWNNNHQTGAKTIIITAGDVSVNAEFQCRFEYEDVVVGN